MENQNIATLHATLCERLSHLAAAADQLFIAADAVAAVAEEDPALADYMARVLPLMDVSIPSAPPSPSPTV